MNLTEFMNHLSTMPVNKLAKQKDIRRLSILLSEKERERVKKIAIAVILSSTDLTIRINAGKIYASFYGKKGLNNYSLEIKNNSPEDYKILVLTGLIENVEDYGVFKYGQEIYEQRLVQEQIIHEEKLAQEQYISENKLFLEKIASKDWPEFSYIKRNLITLFPGRVHLARTLLFKLNELTVDELFLACEYLGVLCNYNDLLIKNRFVEVFDAFRYIRHVNDGSLDITGRMAEFIAWMKGAEQLSGYFQFKIIFFSNLLLASHVYELTDYAHMCPLNPCDDNVFIVTLEQSILQHIYVLSENHEYLDFIFKHNYPDVDCSINNVNNIIYYIDKTYIEIKYRNKIKRELRKKINSNDVQKSNICCETQGSYNFDTHHATLNFSKFDVDSHAITEDISVKKDTPTYANLRPKQQVFRAAVLERYGKRCAVCGIEIEELLEAAHIVPKKNGGLDIVENGLPLCALHHKAFDSNFFCVYPENYEIISLPNGPSLEALLITQKVINCNNCFPHKDMLAWRWNQWVDVVGIS